MNTKVEFRIDWVHGATSVAKSPYRLAPLEMQELSEQLRELQDKVLELLRKEKLYAKFTKSEAVKNWEVPWVGSERDEAHASRSPVLWVEIGESSLTGLELVQEDNDKSLPKDHMADFHHLDDARDIWLAVKAMFGGNDESKKMRKSMLKQVVAQKVPH
ncbi:hypothetical protein Tco_0729697 [Tanacetum coccineum]|uniref:Reverse transcriptase domain-containing protein n=1 Tax=Tanacetum coccineum TaxID=301880 RepID=A0ABQ4YS17_9ASTR